MSEIPALSPSIAHVLTSESALHAWTIHRLLGNRPRLVTEPQERGRLIHALLLEKGEGVEVIDAPDFRSKATREARDAAREAGKIPVLVEKYDAARHTAGIIGKRIAEFGISLADGQSEVRLEWEDDRVLCHGRTDWLSNDFTRVYDIKTADGSVHPSALAAKMLGQAGVIQDTAYRRAVETLHPEVIGRVEVLFLFCETREPYSVVPAYCGGELREIGASRWARALDLWRRCLASDKWPSHVTEPVRLDAPGWAMAKELEKA